MTIDEFRHWLDGFSEVIDGAPDTEQWVRIKRKLDEVEARAAPDFKPLPTIPAPDPAPWSNPWGKPWATYCSGHLQ